MLFAIKNGNDGLSWLSSETFNMHDGYGPRFRWTGRGGKIRTYKSRRAAEKAVARVQFEQHSLCKPEIVAFDITSNDQLAERLYGRQPFVANPLRK